MVFEELVGSGLGGQPSPADVGQQEARREDAEDDQQADELAQFRQDGQPRCSCHEGKRRTRQDRFSVLTVFRSLMPIARGSDHGLPIEDIAYVMKAAISYRAIAERSAVTYRPSCSCEFLTSVPC